MLEQRSNRRGLPGGSPRAILPLMAWFNPSTVGAAMLLGWAAYWPMGWACSWSAWWLAWGLAYWAASSGLFAAAFLLANHGEPGATARTEFR